jgi:pimeloyl-ACP methyl ester carboxylesterase
MDRHPASAPAAMPAAMPADAGPRPWVLLRGLSRSGAHWGDFADRLAAASGAPVFCIDLPGNGTAVAEASPISIPAMLAPVRAQVHRRLAALGPVGPVQVQVYVLALSMGGMLACEWALRHPGELAGIVMVNSSLRGISGITHRLRPSAWPALLPLVAWPVSALHHERTLHRLTSARPGSRDAVVAHWLALHQQAPVTRLNLLRQLLAAARYAAPRRPPALPVLVVNGAADALVDPRCSQALARCWQAGLQVHPRAGHDLPLDEPDWLIQVLLDWQAR